MGRFASLIILGAVIGSSYYLAQQYLANQDFEKKSVQLMRKHSDKILVAMDETPGCKGKYRFKSATFQQAGFFEKTAQGRVYLAHHDSILDIAYSADIIDNYRTIVVKATDLADLQTRATALALSGCDES